MLILSRAGLILVFPAESMWSLSVVNWGDRRERFENLLRAETSCGLITCGSTRVSRHPPNHSEHFGPRFVSCQEHLSPSEFVEGLKNRWRLRKTKTSQWWEWSWRQAANAHVYVCVIKQGDI